MIKQINNLYTFLNYNNITPNQFEIVIARYNEDITPWLILKNYITIYNKGEPLLNIDNCKIINLPNVGSCDHTYLYHIVNNYYNLADINLFITGSIGTLHEKKRNQLLF